MEIKINPIPVNTNSPFSWEVELISGAEDYLLQKYDSVTHPSFRAMCSYDAETNVPEEIVSCLENNFNSFDILYQYNFWNCFENIADWYEYNITEQISLVKDSPGLCMDYHIDNRVIFGVIIINLEDNDCSTDFLELGYQGPTKKNKGIFFLNHDVNVHRIIHNGENDRYTLSIILYLKNLVRK